MIDTTMIDTTTRDMTAAEARTLKAGDGNYRAYVGPPKQFDFMGATQFRLLATLGLQEHHNVLDFGCGSLRAGRLLIPYLQPDRYVGLDPNRWLVEDGVSRELGTGILAVKRPVFDHSDGFTVDHLGRTFDFIVAQSVFSHTGGDLIARALGSMARNLAATGLILATFIHASAEQPEYDGSGWVYPECVTFSSGAILRFISAAGLQGIELPWFHPRQTWYALACDARQLPSAEELRHLSGVVLRDVRFKTTARG